MKRFLTIVLMTTFAATCLVGWFAPGMISWYFSPPVDLAINCKSAVEWGIDKYRSTLLYGTAGGCVLGIIFGALLARRPRAPGP